MTLTSIVFYSFFLLPQPYAISCYGHAMSKCCQYAISDLKVRGGIKDVSIKEVQSFIQNTITWNK
jgi:hypothetical protein